VLLSIAHTERWNKPFALRSDLFQNWYCSERSTGVEYAIDSPSAYRVDVHCVCCFSSQKCEILNRVCGTFDDLLL